MAVASLWWRRWPWRVSSSTAPQLGGRGGDYGEGYSLEPTYGYGSSTTSGTTYTTTTTTGTSNSGGGEGRREFHPSATTVVVATAPAVEEDTTVVVPTAPAVEEDTTVVVPTAPVVEEEDAEDLDDVDEEEDSAKEKLERNKSLVMEFHGGNNLSAVGRWLRELQVGWVLLLGETAESTAGRILVFYSKSWILALQEISESISRCVVDGWRSQQQDDQGTSKHHPPAAASSEFAQLVEATVLKMLPFVDIAVAAPAHTHRPGAAEEKIQILIDLYEALSKASEHILPLLTDCTTTRALLSADLTKLGKAIWDTAVEIRNSIMASLDGRGVDPSGSRGIIHETTRSVTSYGKVLWMNHSLLNRIILDKAVRRGEHVCFEKETVSYLTSSLIIDMVRSLEEQLVTKSQSWFSADLQGLRFLFLINNCYFMFQELQASSQWCLVLLPMPDLARKIDDYIDCYLQVSWATVLKCLQAPPPATPRCFTAYYYYYSPLLTKFGARFQKTYAAQKHWKVPDPAMRKRLRKAIIDRVVPVFTRFLEDNSIDVDAPGVVTTLTPRKVEKMLGELFEG